jgi:hypothetical protein
MAEIRGVALYRDRCSRLAKEHTLENPTTFLWKSPNQRSAAVRFASAVSNTVGFPALHTAVMYILCLKFSSCSPNCPYRTEDNCQFSLVVGILLLLCPQDQVQLIFVTCIPGVVAFLLYMARGRKCQR